MSVQIIMDRDIYLDSPVTPVTLTNAIYAGDADAQRIRFRCFQKHGQIAPMDLSDITITAHFIRPDGGDVVITGVGGSTYSYVDLPEACYVYPGIFKLLVRASTANPDVVTSILYVTGRIDKPTTDVIIDPGTTIPSLEDLLAQIDACEDATDAANAAAADASAAALAGVRTDTDAQGLTDTQKANARTNIAAASADEVSQLSDDIMMLTSVDDIFVNLTDVEMTVDSYLKTDGSIGTNSNFMVSDYIEYPRDAKSLTVNRTVYTPDGTAYQQSKMIWFYDSEKTLLGTGTDPYTSGNLLTVYPHASTKYIRVNFSKNKVMPFICINKTPLVSINSMKNRGYTDMNDVPVNVITGRYATSFTISNLPYTNWLGTVLCMSAYGYASATKIQLAFSSAGRFHYRRSWGNDNTWGNWVEFSSIDELNSILGYVGSYSGTFSGQETIDTGIRMDANGTYIIKFYNTRTDIVNIYGGGNTSSFKKVYTYEDQIAFINDSTARNLMLYNPNSQSDSINIKVYKPDSMMLKSESVPRRYIVSKSATVGDYTSISKCLYDLKDNTDPKIIEIWGGDYDIYEEYCELYDAGLLEIYSGNDPSMDYFPYCVWVPKNTHIIGKGLVRLKWEPDPAEDDITPNQCKTISPLNVAANCIIENVEVYCKNGRYCLHNDGLGKSQFTGAAQKYINCRFYKYDNDVDSVSGSSYGFSQTTGFGIDRNMHHIYENCVFVNYASSPAFYGHSRSSVISNEAQSSDISLINCSIDTQGTTAVRFGNPTTYRNIHIRVMFNGCYISGIVLSRLETSASDSCANGFDVQYLNCGAVTMQINDPDNPYTPKAYNTSLTIVT